MSADKRNKRLWQLINELKNNIIIVKICSKIPTDTQQISDKFIAFFIDKIRDLKRKNNPIKIKDSA
jgi:hypothetical protein